MTLEEREHLFVVWNRLAEQYTAFDLSGLPAGVRQCLFDARACAESANLLVALFRFVDDAQCLIEIRPATLLAVLPPPSTHPMEQPPDLAQMQGLLAPSRQSVLLASPHHHPHQHPASHPTAN